MILTEEDIAGCFKSVFGNGEFGMTGDLSLARAIESAVLNKLQDKLKNAERYEWIKEHSAYVGINIHKECLWTLRGIYEVPNEGFDEAVDYAIEEYGNEQR